MPKLPQADGLKQHQTEFLKRIGISPDAIELYELLLQHGRLTAHASSNLRGTYASAEYRLFYELEKCGLIRRLHGRPRAFEPASINTGMATAYQREVHQLRKLLDTKGSAADETEIVIGRQALYKRYVQLAEQAKSRIYVYAIGIAYSAELETTQRRVMKRGLTFHHLVQEVQPTNYHVVSRWRRLGMRVKHLPAARGFHFMLFDDARVVITFSNSANTEERLSIITDNRQAVHLFGNYFQAMWREARDIEP